MARSRELEGETRVTRRFDPPAGARPVTRERAAIPERYRWDLSDVYPSWSEWEVDLGRMRRLVDAFAELEGTLGQGPTRLLAALSASDELGILSYRVYQLPALASSEDTRDNSVQARLQQVQIELARFRQAVAWLEPELLRIPLETVRVWLDTTPELAPYRFHVLEVFRKHEHVLDEEGERLLAFASRFSGSPSTIYSMLADADVHFPTVTLVSGEQVVASPAGYLSAVRNCPLQEDRERVFRAHFSVFDERPNTYAAVFNGVLQRDWFTARARRYRSCLEAALDDDAIPVEVVESLIATARASSGPLRRYHRLRRGVLGLERYCFFDVYRPLVEVEWRFYFDDVGKVVVDSVEPLGRDYQRTVKRAFKERWLDVYESEGKRSGAFSAGVWGVHPYVLLNHADTLNDAFTVAHEMGHTLHTVLSHQAQPFVSSGYSIFVAEVASMTAEALFLDALLASERDPLRRAVLLQHAVDSVVASFFRQAMLADFELAAHRLVARDEPVTAERLQALYLETAAAYLGDSVDDQELYCNEWARIPHIFHSPFYVFQYATSKAAANVLHRGMTEGRGSERRAAVSRYLTLLRAGGSDHPVTLLERAGVDFSTQAPMAALVASTDALVTALELELERLGVRTNL